MSQSLDIVRGSIDGLFVHLKEIEVFFKDRRPQSRIYLKLKADGKEYKSPQFGKNDAVDWKLKDTFSVPSTAEVSVSVRQHFYKTLFAEVSIKAADILGKQSFSVEGSKGLSITLTCIPAASTDEFIKLIIEEAGRQLSNKKILLESLGKSSEAIALLMKLGDEVKDLHPAVSAAFTATNVLYERCKLQKEVHKAATELVKDLTVFLPFAQELTPSLQVGKINKAALIAIVSDLYPVVYTNSADGGIQVYHPIFSDLIIQAQFWNDPVQLKANIAMKCLQVMHSGLKFNICQLETSYLPTSAIPDLAHRISKCIPQVLQHSCLYWMDHISESVLDLEGSLAVQRLVQRFLSGPGALFWLEVLSLMGEVKSGTEVLAKCINYFKEHNEIKMACVDLYRFTSAFYEGITISTPHLYISALSWVPTDSYMTHQFCPSFSNQNLILKGKDNVWKEDMWAMHTGIALGTGKAVGEPLTGHSDMVTSVAYSPDGRHIVSGSWDKTICIWDAQTGKAVGEPLIGHSGSVWSVAYSPDGMHIVSGSRDKTICIWDGDTESADFQSTERFSKNLGEDGWYKNASGELLLWVPPEYRARMRDLTENCIS